MYKMHIIKIYVSLKSFLIFSVTFSRGLAYWLLPAHHSLHPWGKLGLLLLLLLAVLGDDHYLEAVFHQSENSMTKITNGKFLKNVLELRNIFEFLFLSVIKFYINFSNMFGIIKLTLNYFIFDNF